MHRTHRRLAVTFAAVVFVAMLGGCSRLAIWSAPAKAPGGQRTAAAARADELFWQTLHGGAYERIPQALVALKAAYLEHPNDAVTAAHIGWLHIWRLAERARIPSGPGPEITDDAVLARKYFEEAVRLDPRDARYLGFYASVLMVEGSIHRDEKLVRRGYYTMRDAVAAWPEFNYFTAGYTAASQPHDTARFREGLDAQWRALDLCAGERVDRANPDFTHFMSLDTKEGPKRACWNSWIAPHNVEGFFLNFGDMLVKAGEPATAVRMYQNAKLAREYGTWPYRHLVDDRIANAARNVDAFRQRPPAPGASGMMAQSRYACMGCHER